MNLGAYKLLITAPPPPQYSPMSAHSTYFSTLIALFAAFARKHAVSDQQSAAATVLLSDFLSSTPSTDHWTAETLKLFVTSHPAGQAYDKAAVALVSSWFSQYPPHQSNVAAQQYLLALKADNCSDSTIKNYRSDIGQFLQFVGQSELETAFQKPKVIAFLRYQRQKGLKRSSVRRKLVSLTQFAGWAVQAGHLAQQTSWLQDLSTNLEATNWEDDLSEPVSPPTPNKNYLFWSIPLEEVAGAELAFPAQLSAKTPARDDQELKSRLKANLSTLKQRFALPSKTSTSKWMPYINAFMLIVFLLGGGLLAYTQFGTEANPSLAYPTSLTRPNRTLSFQGRLTDTAKNPITTATDMRFRLYDSGPSTVGGTLLWDSSTCAVTPDQDGIFSTGLGDECGSEITEDVFTENSNVWLQVEIDNGVTWEVLDPRQGIKTVPYALNSETLQGYPASASAVENTVLVMDNNGDVVLGSSSPTLSATGDSFTIEAQTLTLQTASGSNGDILLSPDGTGQVFVNSDLDVTGFISAPGATLSANYAGGTALVTRGGPSGTANIQEWQNSGGTPLSLVNRLGYLGIGTTDPNGLLHVSGAATGKALAIFNETGNQDIITASASGATRFRLTSVGDIYAERFFDNSNNLYFVDPAASGDSITVAGNVGIGSTSPGYKLDVAGTFNLTSALYANGDAGTSGYLLTSAAGGAMTWTDPSTLGGGASSVWTVLNGLIYPNNSTTDFAIGGTASDSAKFTVLNVNSGTPTASVSAGVAGATFLTANGTLSTTAMQNLTIGSSTTGDVIFSPSRNVGIGTSTPSFKLDVNGAARISTLAAGATDTVVTHSSGELQTRTIDTRVWGSSLVDGTGSSDRVAYWSDANTLTNSANFTFNGTFAGLNQLRAISSSGLSLVDDSGVGMFIADGGNIGLGTTAPVGKLNVEAAITGKALAIFNETGDQDVFTASVSGTPVFRIANNGAVLPGANNTYNLGSLTERWADLFLGPHSLHIGSNGNEAIIGYDTTSNYLGFDPDGDATFELVMNDDGNLGIGSTSPAAKLDVVGNAHISGLAAGGLVKAAATTGLLQIATAGTDYENPLTFTNGLTRSTNTVTLGGTLTQNTNIAQAGFNFTLTGLGKLGIGTSTPTARFHLSNQGATPSAQALAIFDQYDSTKDIITASAAGNTKYRLTSDGSIYAKQLIDIDNTLYYLDPASQGTSLVTAGNIGIGSTASPGTRVTAYTLPENYGFEHTDGTRQLSTYVGTAGTFFGSRSNHSLNFFVNDGIAAPAMTINTSSNVGIGTTAPNSLLHLLKDGSGLTVNADSYTGTNGAARSILNMRKSRGSRSTPTAVQSGDSIGGFAFSGHDGTDFVLPALVETFVDGTVSTGSVPARISFVTGTAFGDRAERMTIKSGGNVGIGTTSPLAPLHIQNGSYPSLILERPSANAGLQLTDGSTTADIYYRRNQRLSLQPPGTSEPFVIENNSGNVGIGTTGPTSKLHVVASGVNGLNTAVTNASGGTIANLYGTLSSLTTNSGSTTTRAYGLSSTVAEAGGTVTHAFGNYSQIGINSGSIGSGYGFYADSDQIIGGSMTNYAGVFIETTALATNNTFLAINSSETIPSGNFGIYNASTYKNYFAGNIGIGTTAPTQVLTVNGNISLQSSGTETGQIRAGTSVMDIDHMISGTSASAVRFFRLTNTTGSKTVQFLRGNNSTTVDAQIGVDGSNSFFQMNGGNVGIGTSSPAEKLHVNGNIYVGGNAIYFDNENPSQTSGIALDTTSTGGLEVRLNTSQTSGVPIFRVLSTGLSERLRVDHDGYTSTTNSFAATGAGPHYFSSGNLGIGTSSPSQKLDVVGDIELNGDMRLNGASTYNFIPDTGSDHVRFGQTSGSNYLGFDLDQVGMYTFGNATSFYAQVGQFQVAGSTTNTPGARLESHVASGETIANARLSRDLAAETNRYFLQMWRGPNVTQDNEFLFRADGHAFADQAWNGGGADVAEIYNFDEPVQPGDLVSIPTQATSNPGKTLKKSRGEKYDPLVVGVISTDPGLVAGFGAVEENTTSGHNEARKPVALVGRVPVKVNLENGPIKPGDYLTSSSKPGEAMKATQPGRIIGQALEAYDGSKQKSPGVITVENEFNQKKGTDTLPVPALKSGEAKIMVYVTTGWYDPSMMFSSEGELVLNTATNTVTPVNGSTPLNNIGAFATAVAGKIKASLVETEKLIVKQTANITSLSVDSLRIRGMPLADYIRSVVSSQPTQLANPVVTPPPTATGSGKLAALLVEQNATVSGSLTASSITTSTISAQTSQLGALLANTASVSGELIAESVTTNNLNATSSRMDQLEARMAELQHVKAQTAELMEATVSGTLYANNIYDFENKIATSFEKPGLIDILKQNLPGTVNSSSPSSPQVVYNSLETSQYAASSSADLNLTLSDLELTTEDVTLTAQALFLDKYFKVNGAAYVADSLGVGKQLFVGTGTTISDGSIAYAAPEGQDQILAIQPSGQGSISLLAGLMTLTDTGLVTVNGDFTVAGSVTVENTLLTNLVQPADFGNPFQVQVAGVSDEDQTVRESRFEIINEIGTPVATISAQGRAAFADGIDIGAENLSGEGENPEVNTKKSSGKATIPANSSEITILTDRLKSDTLIYVTPVGSTQNQVLYVKSQQAHAGETQGKFVVGFDETVTQEVQFNWWLVN